MKNAVVFAIAVALLQTAADAASAPVAETWGGPAVSPRCIYVNGVYVHSSLERADGRRHSARLRPRGRLTRLFVDLHRPGLLFAAFRLH
jgi:hypothetical protein